LGRCEKHRGYGGSREGVKIVMQIKA